MDGKSSMRRLCAHAKNFAFGLVYVRRSESAIFQNALSSTALQYVGDHEVVLILNGFFFLLQKSCQ
jgi:hypothetical protein